MRKLIIRIIGGLCIVIALMGFGKLPLAGLFEPGAGYNAFLLTMGIFALAVSDLGPTYRRGFDFIFGFILVILCAASAGALLSGSPDVRIGTVIFNGFAAILVLYAGLELPDQINKL